MSQILVRDLAPETVKRLKVMASRSQRSLQGLVKQLLDEVAAQDSYNDEFVKLAGEIRARSGPQATSGVELIREDRDSR